MQALTDDRFVIFRARRKLHRLVDEISTPQSRAGRAYPLMVTACGIEQQTGSRWGDFDSGLTRQELLSRLADFNKRRCVKCFPVPI